MSGFVPQSILVTHGGASSSPPSPNTRTHQLPPFSAIERRSTVPRKSARQVNPSTPPPPSCQLDSERSASVASNEPQRADNVAESPQRRSGAGTADAAAHRACDGGEDTENDVFSCEMQSAEVRAASPRRCTSSGAPLPAATRAGSKRASWNASVSRSATLAGSADQPPSSHRVPKEAGEHPDRSCVLSLRRQSFVGPLLAVLERSVRQLLHRKLDFVFEMAMSLVFVAIAVLLWGIGGSVNIRQEQMYGVADVQVPGESECSLASPFIVMPYLHDPCYIVPDPAKESPFFTQHACTFHNTRLSLAAAQALDYECVSNLSQIPVESLSICRQADISWDVALNIYLLRYLLDLLKLPTIDGIIELQWFALGSGNYARQQALPSAQGLVSNSRFNAVLCSGNLYFVGDVSSTAALITYLGKTSSLLRYVNDGNVHASVAAARAAANGRSVWSIVELRRMDAGGLDLVLHMNNSALPSFRTTYDTAYPGGVAYDTFELYILSGYLTLQQAVSEYYLNTFHAIPTPELIFTHHTPTVPYTRLPTLLNAMETFPFIFSFVFIYSVSQQAKRIVQERELRLREAMLIMGLPQWTLYVGELVMQVAVFVVTCALATVLLRLTFVTKSDPLLVFLVFFLFALTTIPLSGLIAAFVSHAEHAALVAPVVYMVSIAPMVATSNVRGSLVTGFSVLSPSGFAAAMKLLLQHEASTGCDVAELRSSEDNPTLAVILAMLVGDFVVYYVLMLYVDAVVPKEWGTPKHPLFFVVEPARWLLGRARCVPAGGPDGRAADGVFETKDYTADVVRFAGLRKEYARGGKAFVAVDNLYWGMREGEISVLVGHNGAGKTTVLNMVTGMVAADGGDCVVYGASVRTSRDAVRQDLGYCPQHNILWSELTCRDHLEFYAKVKGLRGWALEDAVCRLLYEADLLEKADVAAARLSGGQKRRLSVAIAFVGGGRLVLLDEPTAGLDVGARRQVWELLKRMARTRVVLLTTHYMDEADLLGSRIAMLSQGRLKLSGSSAFLKLRLGVGYRLVVGIGRGEDSKNVDRVVFGGVHGAVKESRSATELSYRLPDRSVEDFPAVLRAVERGDADGVRGYALTATTLEDVYVRASEADAVDDRVAAAEEDIELIWSCEVYQSVAWSQFKAMLAKRLWCALRDRRMQCLQVVCPIACILIAMILGLVNFSAPRTLEMDFGMFGREQRSQLLSLNCEHLWGTAPTAPNVDVTAVDRSLHIGDASQLKMYLADTWYVHPAPRFGAIACWNRDIDGRNNQTIFNASLCPSIPFQSSILLLQNTSSRHQAPVNLGLYYNLRLQEKVGEGGPTVRYTTQLLEKPATYTQLSYIYAVAIIAAPFMLLPSAAAAWIVKERELGARSLQDMCGLSVPVYWAANFAFDVLSYILVALLFVTIFAIFQRTDLVGADRVGGTLLLFVVSGCTSTVYMYCWSFLFKEHGTAQAVTAIVNFFLGFAMILIVYVLTMNADYAHIPPKLRYGFRVVPSYCILEGLLGLLTLTVNVRVGAARSVWDMDQLGWPLVYMAAEFPLLWAVVLLADHPRVQRAVGLCGYRRNAPPEVGCDEDSDVEEERRAVYEAQNNPTRADVLRMVDLRKTYGDGTAAVRGVTLSVFASEVFGLLGTNGAGKTTTLSMLCQRVVPSGGSAYVCGYDVVAESAEALACIGCCPQADATLDLLTVEEQLQLYAGIRGIPGEHWERVVAALCSLCMLTAYRTTVTCALSGGNRRKLSVALSMIGGPRVLFLDEPTAGMDPVTRRGVWAAIRRAAGYCSVVLTTHHLEEVERVADAVAIMVRGSVQCIGDAAYLKEKFSRVAEVELVVGAGCDCAGAEEFVAARMAGAVRVGGDGRRLVYHVPCEGGVGELFALLQAHQAALRVVDYRVSATSIEETFVRVKTKAELRGRGPALHSSEIVAGKARVY